MIRLVSFAILALQLTSCRPRQTHLSADQNRSNKGKPVYRFNTIDAKVKEKCKSEASRTYCGDSEESGLFFSCMEKMESGLDISSPCSVSLGKECVRFEKTGETCYADKEDCKKPKPDTCNFYSDCLESYHTCGESGYARSYGLKYCYAFRDLKKDFSAEAQKWLASTMQCLQTSLTEFLDKKSDCDRLNSHAFESHVRCYTQPGSSVCDIKNFSDLSQIARVVETKEFLRKQSLRQMIKVATICIAGGQGTNLAVAEEPSPEVRLFWEKKQKQWEEMLANIKID